MKNAKLIQLGFEETIIKDEDDPKNKITEYGKGELRLTLFDYAYKTGQGVMEDRKTFVVSTKKTTSEAHPIEELNKWLELNDIK